MFNAMEFGTICNSEDLKVLAIQQNSGSDTLSEDTRIVSETTTLCHKVRCANGRSEWDDVWWCSDAVVSANVV